MVPLALYSLKTYYTQGVDGKLAVNHSIVTSKSRLIFHQIQFLGTKLHLAL